VSADTAGRAPSGRIEHDVGGGFSPGRVYAMLLRYVYLLRGSWPRALELVYWPTIQMVLWGFMSQFLMTNSTWVAHAFGVLLAAVLLWDVMFRGQLGVSMSFLEEMWARNLGHLFVSPLRPYEWVVSLLAMSLIRVMIGVVPAMLLAIPLYHYSIFSLGLPFIAFFVDLLVMGWALGLLITALILRHGLGAESIAWLAIFMLAPVSAVYYPVTVLPLWLQPVALALPALLRLRGHAGGDVRPRLPARSVSHRERTRRRLYHSRRHRLPLRLPQRQAARRAAAGGGVAGAPCNGGPEMAHKVTHGISLSEDRRTVALQIATDTLVLSANLDLTDVDMLIDALIEIREQMAPLPRDPSD